MPTPPERKEITIHVDPGGAWASVAIPAGYDPGMLAPDTLATLARASGVVVESTEYATLRRIIDAYRAEPRDVNVIFARAAAAQRGEDACVDWEEAFAPAEACADSASSIDHYSVNTLRLVHEGDHVATIHAETPGVEGRDVSGNAVPATHGAKPLLTFSQKHFREDEEGRVYALYDGVIRVRSNACTIEDVLRVGGNVDFESGNIDTKGSVVVTGDIRDRFEVRAERDIEVIGLVEAATVRCAGSLTIRKGMTGRGTGTFSAGGDVEVGFLDSVRGDVGGELRLRREAISCTLRVAGGVIGPRAALIGGELTAGGAVDIGTLGSVAEAPTKVRVGSLPALEKELADAKERQAEAQRRLNDLDREERQLRETGCSLTTDQKERFTEIAFLRSEQFQRFQDATQRIEEIETIHGERASVELVVRSIIHPRVSIVTEEQDLTLSRPVKGPVTFGWSRERRLMMQRSDGKWYDAEASVRRAA
jgi:uncharacterized protein